VKLEKRYVWIVTVNFNRKISGQKYIEIALASAVPKQSLMPLLNLICCEWSGVEGGCNVDRDKCKV
jgi:hypothetical protein